ncbi:MAG: HPr kinase/phosphatase C-terminal domain-containing protein [Novosphingobium sp.]|uniref:HPr kinase/phosphorylase n=1 Tax=Novosphingobium sp. TaxID=1874826 RepID=UPI00301AE0B2
MTEPLDILHHQATAVWIDGQCLLIEGAPGSGKSSLALALIDRGAALIGDDGVSLERDGTRLVASPVPATCGLLEVRNLGIIEIAPVMLGVPVALVVLLDREAPRFITEPEIITLHGVELPRIRLWPDTPVLPLRAERALQHYGLPPPRPVST